MGEFSSVDAADFSARAQFRAQEPSPALVAMQTGIHGVGVRGESGAVEQETDANVLLREVIKNPEGFAAKNGEKALQEIWEKGYPVFPDTDYKALHQQLVENPQLHWQSDTRTAEYIQHAVAVSAARNGEEAIVQLRDLKVPLGKKTTADSVLDIVARQHGWARDVITKNYIQQGLDVLRVQQEVSQSSGDTNGHREPALEKTEDSFYMPRITIGFDEYVLSATEPPATPVETGTEPRGEELAIDEASAKEAVQKLQERGIVVTADSDAGELIRRTRETWDGWQEDEATLSYVDNAINYIERTATPPAKETGTTTTVRYITAEPHVPADNTVFLGQDMRVRLGVKPGEVVRLRLGGSLVSVKVARPRVRDYGTPEAGDTSVFRVSKDLFETLGIPQSYAAVPSVDAAKKEIVFGQAPSENPSLVKMPKPRPLAVERADGRSNTIYLSAVDQERLGVKPGETLTVRLGGLSKQVAVAVRSGIDAVDDQSWQLSKNIIDEFGLPGEVSLRSRFDRATRELRFGPYIGIYAGARVVEGKLWTYTDHAEEMIRTAREKGGVAIVINPYPRNRQLLDAQLRNVQEGFVAGYMVFPNGTFKEVRMPIPDILYDKEYHTEPNDSGDGSIDVETEGIREQCKRELSMRFEHRVFPPGATERVVDKLYFADILQQRGLGEYHPESRSLSDIPEQDLESFLTRHTEAIIKPQWGTVSRGIFKVTKTESGEYVIPARTRGSREDLGAEIRVKSVKELMEKLSGLDVVQTEGGIGKFYIQEKMNLMEYRYQDPLTHEEIVGTLEPRIMVMRGVDGKPYIGGMVARLMNDKSPTPHMKNLRYVFEGMYPGQPDRAKELMKQIEEMSLAVHRVLEEDTRGEEIGELTVDIGITADGKPMILEANSRGNNFTIFTDAHDGRTDTLGLKDGVANRTLGGVDFALHRTDMH